MPAGHGDDPRDFVLDRSFGVFRGNYAEFVADPEASIARKIIGNEAVSARLDFAKSLVARSFDVVEIEERMFATESYVGDNTHHHTIILPCGREPFVGTCDVLGELDLLDGE